jgi:thiamine biosynthesis lipoprotein
VHVIGAPSNGVGWRIGWHPPHASTQAFTLRDAALSVSAVHGKAFAEGGRTYGHVLDPRTGLPTRMAVSAVVTGPGSLEADALSTALLVLGAGWIPSLRIRFPGYDGDVR